MKVLTIAVLMFFITSIFICSHTYIMSGLSENITHICNDIEQLALSEKWIDVIKSLDEIETLWYKTRLWAVLTISTNEIDRIEISLRQCTQFAKLGAKPDFFGEFTNFRTMIERIPRKEGFHLEEVL